MTRRYTIIAGAAILLMFLLSSVADAATNCRVRGNPEVRGYVLCCCVTQSGNTCCASMIMCGGYVAGCFCRN